jgi:thiazole/oxazole-forming peptide maturase SagD family component
MNRVIFLNENNENLPFREEFVASLSHIQSDLIVLIAFGFEPLKEVSSDLADIPFLLVTMRKDCVAIGRVHVPGRSACFRCLKHWIMLHCNDHTQPAGSFERSEARFAADLVREIIQSGDHNQAEDFYSIQAFNMLNGKLSIHPIVPLRDCKTCAPADFADVFSLRSHCSALTGIVCEMQMTQNPAAGAYRAVATWRSPLPVRGARPRLNSQKSHGRGRTPEDAEQGCIGEALERYSLIYRGDEPLTRAKICDVRALNPNDILLYSDLQYETRDLWNSTADERYFVGERFDPKEPIEWLPAVDLTDCSAIFVPAACSLMWYMFAASEKEYARADSIGCGSGWTFDDALAHALLEWIERDAMAIWWYNRLRRPVIRLDSLNAPELLEVRDGLRRIDRDLVLLDCTTDISVPTYISIAARMDGTEPLFAGAAHPSPRVAAWKAASEVGQLWFTIVQNKCIDIEMKNWLETTIDAQPFLNPTHMIDAPPEPAPLSASDQVRLLVGRFESAGLRSYAVDLSRADVVLKTARAIVPGLRHIWNRRAPGRLYDVPVRLGWLKEPLHECELNPVCCMI